MKRRVAIFIACLSFALGIVSASLLPKDQLSYNLYFFAPAAFFSVLAAWSRGKKNVRAVFIWAAFLFLGAWRLAASLPVDAPDKIWHYNGQDLEFYAQVSSPPAIKGRYQRFEAESLAWRQAGALLPLGGRTLVNAPRYPEYPFGAIVRLSCRPEAPGMIEDFDYSRYLAAKNIYSLCPFPRIEVLDLGDQPSALRRLAGRNGLQVWFWKKMFFIREGLAQTIGAGLPEPQAGLLAAFILGEPTVPDDLNQSFRQSGLSHIVAISGSHISLVIAIIFFCLLSCGLNRRASFWLAAPMILFYVLLAGAPASAVRAGVMGFLVLLAMYFGRLARLDHSLALAGAAMLFINPKLIIADAGFQLSFLAVFGMIYLYPVFDGALAKLYEGRAAALKLACQTIALTLAAQIFTAPILIFSFRQISLVAPLANLLALWAAPFIMISAFIAIGLSLIIPAGALLFFLPAGFLVQYLIAIAEFSARLPFAFWKI